LILKIIGIVLASVIGLILLLVLLVLFAPISYNVKVLANGTFEGLDAKLKASYLFFIIRVKAQFQGKNAHWKVKLLWKTLSEGEKCFGKSETEKTTENENVSANNVDANTYDTNTFESSADVDSREDDLDEQVISEDDAEEIEISEIYDDEFMGEDDNLPIVDEKSDRKSWKDRTRGKSVKGYVGWLKGIKNKLKSFFIKLNCTIKEIYVKIKKLLKKKDLWLGFIESEIHKRALKFVLLQLKRFFIRIKPKTLNADLKFGFEDPYTTGSVLAGLSVIFPWMGEGIRITPDFEKKLFEGNILLKGKLRVIAAVILAWKIFWNKDVRKTYTDFKKLKV
jgi:energy-coupling factor transporter transmembrane protein EcfT